MRWFKRKHLMLHCSMLLLVWCAVSLSLQPVAAARPLEVTTIESPIHLSQGWKFQRGDNPAWAKTDGDDSQWEELDITTAWKQLGYEGYNGFSWYRREIHLPWAGAEAQWHRPLGITLGAVGYSSYEVYAGGELIGRFGLLPPSPQTPLPCPMTFPIPAQAINPQGHLIVAVRLWRNPAYANLFPKTGDFPSGPFALGAVDTLQEHVEVLRQRRLLSDLSPLIFFVAFILVGLYHLQLYRRRHQLTEYFWYSLFTLGVTVNVFFRSLWANEFFSWVFTAAAAKCVIHLTAMFYVRFLWPFLSRPIGPWLRAYQALQGIIALGILIKPDMALQHPLSDWLVVSLIPIMVVGPAIMIQEAWRGHPDARTLSLGGVVFLACAVVEVLRVLGLLISPPMVQWGLAAFILSMAASLSNRFSRVYGELDALNQELENKVADRTAELAQTVEQLQVSEKQALEAKEVALDASRAKSTFLANMSHELRTPLNAILGFVQLMKRSSQLDADNRESLNIITRSGEHLLGLITDVLSISKIEAGQMILNEQPFDLRRLLQGLKETFQMRAETKGLHLIFDVTPDLPQFVLGDEGKLRQVLINLLGNAFKFTDEGGVAVRAKWQSGQVFFEVEDTGPGISPDEIGKLFEAFAQTSSGQKAKEGTGLGLAISRNYVRLMGGDLTVTSQEGKGAVFRIKVPLPVAAATEAQLEIRRVIGLDSGQRPYRILAVDDILENRQLLFKLMMAVGFQCREAVNGQEAVEIWESWHPDLIWMDMRMPVMGGIEATKAIRMKDEGGRMKKDDSDSSFILHPSSLGVVIIALTASAFEHDRDNILAAGCDDVVTKPFREETLFDKMIEHLGVRFIYEGVSPSVAGPVLQTSPEGMFTPEKFAGLPTAWVAQFNQVVTEGDIDGAYRIIDQLSAGDEALAKELRAMIKAYRFDEILNVLEKV